MFTGFSQRTLDFMWELRLHNEKPWFEAHKDEYLQDFLAPMKELGREVFARVTEARDDHGFIHKVSRIYRDARRVRGGEPYRDHLWFSVERPSENWTGTPVFWFELSPDNWSYGLGYWLASPATMAKLRARIDRKPKAFEQLIAFLDRQDEFVLDGPEYKRRKAAPTPKTEPWYNKKGLSLIHIQENGPELYEPTLADRITKGFLSLMPLYDYLITLDADPEPVSRT
jgi:uncharacterized protein (TIGR02453 family)